MYIQDKVEEYADEIFDRRGQLRNIKDLKPWALASVTGAIHAATPAKSCRRLIIWCSFRSICVIGKQITMTAVNLPLLRIREVQALAIDTAQPYGAWTAICDKASLRAARYAPCACQGFRRRTPHRGSYVVLCIRRLSRGYELIGNSMPY